MLLVILIVIQFIGPAENIAEGVAVDDITTVYNVPDDVQQLVCRLKKGNGSKISTR